MCAFHLVFELRVLIKFVASINLCTASVKYLGAGFPNLLPPFVNVDLFNHMPIILSLRLQRMIFSLYSYLC